ncbi:hypothetical protein NPIL_373341 [Nephila pilipes]|uniref:Uncharacterized protein n=1 Tax=Nephila pilipes TaxID=299642 RepID=A0A8X6J4S0_NEPPI|nr:hypothetical protein NPIL_373341 [Nephila pilipes]
MVKDVGTFRVEFLPSVANLHSTVVKRTGYHSVASPVTVPPQCNLSLAQRRTNPYPRAISWFINLVGTLTKQALSGVTFRGLSELILNALSFLRMNYLNFSGIIRKDMKQMSS